MEPEQFDLNNHPFVNDRKLFQSVPEGQRSAYRTKLLELTPLEGQPKEFKSTYPNNEKWMHSDAELNYYYMKVQKPRAIMFYFHGLNSHGGSSAYMGCNISKSLDIDVYSLDFRNFGQSKGEMRGYLHSFEQSCQEAGDFVDFILKNYDSAHLPKVILSGLSFGGSICLKLAASHPQKYQLLVMLSPGLRTVPESQPFMKQVGKMMGYLFPKMPLINPTFKDGNKYDMSERIKADPLNYTGRVIPGSIRTVLNGIDEIQPLFKELKTPYILFQSGKDKLVDVFAPLDLEKISPSQDKTTIYCKDMWHSVFSEEEIQQIVPIVTQWLRKRV